jgi:hypothetical protein
MTNFAHRPKTPIEAFDRLIKSNGFVIEIPEDFHIGPFEEDTVMVYDFPIEHPDGNTISIQIHRDSKISYRAEHTIC